MAQIKRTQVGSETNYLRRASDYLNDARSLCEQNRWASAASLGIHAIIASCDAMTAFFLRGKYSGSDHKGLVVALGELRVDPGELKRIKKLVGDSLSSKTEVEYGERTVRPNEARAIVSAAEEILNWTKKHVEGP
ncbi:MAG: HEPN domain-containing protein [Actinobacteria bacterium]|nr:HEPN domain-containing protein [Actinomycetota bacterium]